MSILNASGTVKPKQRDQLTRHTATQRDMYLAKGHAPAAACWGGTTSFLWHLSEESRGRKSYVSRRNCFNVNKSSTATQATRRAPNKSLQVAAAHGASGEEMSNAWLRYAVNLLSELVQSYLTLKKHSARYKVVEHYLPATHHLIGKGQPWARLTLQMLHPGAQPPKGFLYQD